MIPVREGLEVRAQNAWPSVKLDLGRVLDRTAPLWHAAFYHKTFKWPSWDFYERFIRRTAGIAKPPREPDPARYETVNAHCDLLVVGGGPAGLLAAQVASRAGLRVILAEQDFECGGRLLATNTLINDAPVTVWFASVLGELAPSRNVTLLTATTCFGLYDHGTAGLLQRLDLGSKPGALRQRYWRVHAKQTLLATGAIEQPLLFEENDKPGVMLAGAIRSTRTATRSPRGARSCSRPTTTPPTSPRSTSSPRGRPCAWSSTAAPNRRPTSPSGCAHSASRSAPAHTSRPRSAAGG
jgi:sarcosine oxidase subunit alpha